MNAPDLVAVDGELDDAAAGSEIAGFLGDPVHPPEHFGHELAEGNQVDFVVAADDRAVGIEQKCRVERRLRGVIADASEQEICSLKPGDSGDVFAKSRVAGIKRRGNFGPQNQMRSGSMRQNATDRARRV